MGAKSILVVAGVAIATLLYLVYLGATFEPPEGTTTIVVPAPTPRPVQPEPEPQRTPPPQRSSGILETSTVEPAEEVTEPQSEEVLVETEPEVEEIFEPEIVELPGLNQSDSFIAERLAQLSNGAALLSYLADEQLIRRFVVLVENVSRGTLPQTNLPYRDVPGDFPVRAIDDNLFEMNETGYRRFDQVVEAILAVDTDQAMTLYRLASPLFQQAYAELGFRDENFDDTLRRAIRNVLDTEEISGPLQLVKPSVMYLYADSQVEGMSDIQKQLIRIGPDNSEKVKAKLRQVMQRL